MNHETISQIVFVHRFQVEAAHSATRMHGAAARQLADVLSSAHLLCLLETECLKALREGIDGAEEVALGAALTIDHVASVAVGQWVQLTGFVSRLGQRSVTFEAEALAGRARIAAATIRLVVLPRERWAARTEMLAAEAAATT